MKPIHVLGVIFIGPLWIVLSFIANRRYIPRLYPIVNRFLDEKKYRDASWKDEYRDVEAINEAIDGPVNMKKYHKDVYGM